MGRLREWSSRAVYVGLAVLVTIWASNFSDFMLLEDLGLEDSEAAVALYKISPGERLLFTVAVITTAGGFIGFVANFWSSRRKRP
jgi:ethanolamine utilization microcompartment shell protein EutS